MPSSSCPCLNMPSDRGKPKGACEARQGKDRIAAAQATSTRPRPTITSRKYDHPNSHPIAQQAGPLQPGGPQAQLLSPARRLRGPLPPVQKSPQLITVELSQASSLQQLLECVEGHRGSLNAIHASAVLVRAARLREGAVPALEQHQHHRQHQQQHHLQHQQQQQNQQSQQQQNQLSQQQQGPRMQRPHQPHQGQARPELRAEEAALAELVRITVTLLLHGRRAHAAPSEALQPPQEPAPPDPPPAPPPSSSPAPAPSVMSSLSSPSLASPAPAPPPAPLVLSSLPSSSAAAAAAAAGPPLPAAAARRATPAAATERTPAVAHAPAAQQGGAAGPEATRARVQHRNNGTAPAVDGAPLLMAASPRELANAAWALVKLEAMLLSGGGGSRASSMSPAAGGSRTEVFHSDKGWASGGAGARGPASAGCRGQEEQGAASLLPIPAPPELAHHFCRAVLRAAATPRTLPAASSAGHSQSDPGVQGVPGTREGGSRLQGGPSSGGGSSISGSSSGGGGGGGGGRAGSFIGGPSFTPSRLLARGGSGSFIALRARCGGSGSELNGASSQVGSQGAALGRACVA